MNVLLNVAIYFIGLLYINRFTDNSIFKVLPIALYFAGALRIFILYNAKYPFALLNKQSRTNLMPLWFLLLVLFIGLLRSNNPASTGFSQMNAILNFILFAFFIISVYCEIIFTDFDVKYEKIIITYVVYPFFLYVLTNIIFWALNISPGNDEEAESLNIGGSVLLSITGLSLDRVKFPFASGMNSFAVVTSGILSMVLVYMFVIKRYSIVNFLIIIILFFAVILTDSRSALLYPIIVCIVIGFLKKTNKIYVLKLLPYLFFFGPLIMASLLPLLAQIKELEQFSRNSEDLLTGNARFFIWAASLKVFSYFEPIHIIGYGQYGHYSSGASESWSFLFNKYENYMAVHPHNSALSILFDYGYLGVIFFFILFINISKRLVRLWESQPIFCAIASAFYTYFVLISITETFFGFYYINSMCMTLSIFILIFIVDYIEQSKKGLNKHNYDRSNKIRPIETPSRNRAPFERGSVYAGVVQFSARKEK